LRIGACRPRQKAVVAVSDSGLPFSRAGSLISEAPGEHWLFEGLWGRTAIGLIGGAPKCCKSWLGLELAVALASGTDALDHFPVAAQGPALVFLAEDALPQVKERIEALCRHRGVAIEALDLFVITAPSLRIDQQGDQERLAMTIESVKPRLLVLDPLVRLHALDENSAGEISGLLSYIRGLQRRFDLAIAIVHHSSKKQRAQPGQALRGSSDLHAIGDSNVYLARKDDGIQMTIEHRAARPPDPMMIELVTELDGAIHLAVRGGGSAEDRGRSLDERIIEMLAQAGSTLSRTEMRARLRVNNQKLGDALARLEQAGRVHRGERGWELKLSVHKTW